MPSYLQYNMYVDDNWVDPCVKTDQEQELRLTVVVSQTD